MAGSILAIAALFASVLACSATVTVQGWWHLDSTQPTTDSSGNNRAFGSAFSNHPNSGGQVNALLINNGAGGPLGSSGWTSTQCIRLGYLGVDGHPRQSSMWGIGYVPPSTNFGIELWAMPQNTGYINGTTWYFSSGDSGGVVLRCVNNGDGTSSMVATILGANIDVGDPALIDTNRWTHYAIVNDNGTTTFYTNGAACGASDVGNATASAGTVYIGTPSDNQAIDAYLDEARMFTFAPGAFSTTNLLLRTSNLIIIGEPQSASVWNGGAASFIVNPSFDNSILYQWQRGGANLGGQTLPTLYFNTVALTDSGSNFECVVTLNGSSKTSAPPAVLTVVPVNPSNVAAYRNPINAEPSLLAYFPVDNDIGATLSNTKDGTRNGAFEGGATYDGQTSTTFGQRSVSFRADGDIQIPNNPAFEFPTGNGTIEAVVNLREATGSEPTIFSETYDGGPAYYVFAATKDGGNLICYSDVTNQLSWPVPGGLIGKLTHVALVFNSGVNVTAYANGQNLGTKTQTSFGAGSGAPAWIGGVGTGTPDYRWDGTVDEVAVYGSALSQDTVQAHYSNFFYGTNTTPPSIVSQPSSKTLLAGGSPVLTVQASGTLPLTYKWSTNGVLVPGGTTPTLALPPSAAGSSISCTLAIHNSYGDTNIQPVVLGFVAPPAGYPSAVMNDNPSGFWRLTETAGLTAVDSAGLNDGAYSSTGVTNGVPGIPAGGTAVQFDGASGTAVVPYAAALNPSGPFTIEFWAKVVVAGGSTPFSSMNRPSRSGGYEFYNQLNFNGFEFHTAAAGNYSALAGDGTAPSVGVWYHLAGVFDGFSIFLFVNGEPASSFFQDNPDLEEGTAPFAPNSAAGFYMGCRSTLSSFFNGALCNFAFYGHALSQDQLRRHVFAGLGAPINVALARAAGVVADSKPVGTLHAGLNNGATWVASSSDGTTTRNGVMQFNGTSGSQITLAPNPDFYSTQGTIMFWMKSAGTTGTNTGGAMLVDHRLSDPGGDIIVQNDDGSLFVQAQNGISRNGSPADIANTFSTGAVSDNLWHHVAYVYDQSASGSITIYVDGALANTQANAAAWNWPVTQEIELGKSHDSNWKQFDGQMDDFRIYSRMLTEPEVASVHSTGALVDTNTLQVRFNFDAAPASGSEVSWTPSVAVPQSATAVTGPYATQPTGRTPFLVAPPGGNQFFRAKSP